MGEACVKAAGPSRLRPSCQGEKFTGLFPEWPLRTASPRGTKSSRLRNQPPQPPPGAAGSPRPARRLTGSSAPEGSAPPPPPPRTQPRTARTQLTVLGSSPQPLQPPTGVCVRACARRVSEGRGRVTCSEVLVPGAPATPLGLYLAVWRVTASLPCPSSISDMIFFFKTIFGL